MIRARAIRNIRHRTNIKTREHETIQQLKRQTRELDQKLIQLERRIYLLTKVRQIEDTQFKNRLEIELMRLKDRKPELFTITGQEQINKLAVEFVTSLVRYLIE
jgi:hypothetical protein